MTGNFVQGSKAADVLVIVYSRANDSDIHYISNNGNQTVNITVTGLHGTEYDVSVYSLENGIPFPRAVSSPKNVSIKQDNQGLYMQIISTLQIS